MHRHGLRLLFILLCATASLWGCHAQVQGDVTVDSVATDSVLTDSVAADTIQWRLHETGLATYYSARTHGRMMASGERYHKDGLFCAHRTLPFGTRLRVVNTKNGKEVEVVVKDRGPFSKGRIVDLSNKAAEALDMIRAGVAPVEVWVLEKLKIEE